MFRRIVFGFSILAAAGLMVSSLARSIDPNSFWLIAFAGILFPYLFVLNLLFAVLWIVMRKWYLLIPLLCLFLVWPSLKTVFPMHFSKTSEGGIKLMSYNVKNFDLYNWSNNVNARNQMIDLIRKADPDILCLQEFFTNDKDEFNNIKVLHKQLGYPYYHYEDNTVIKKNHWGAATFSKYPIVEGGKVELPGKTKNLSIYSDIKLPDTIVRVYNLHLQSIYLGDEDYDYLKELSDMKKADANSTLKIIRKMKVGYQRRAEHADAIHTSASNYEGCKIICGDFNDTPVSYTYEKIANGLQDAFLKKGSGFGKTFVSKIPTFRIDYILIDQALQVSNYDRIKMNYSDHYPIVATFSIAK